MKLSGIVLNVGERRFSKTWQSERLLSIDWVIQVNIGRHVALRWLIMYVFDSIRFWIRMLMSFGRFRRILTLTTNIFEVNNQILTHFDLIHQYFNTF